MRVVSERQLAIVLGALAGTPRVVVGGNFATPWRALAVLDGTLTPTGTRCCPATPSFFSDAKKGLTALLAAMKTLVA